MTKIFIGSDHAGFILKQQIVNFKNCQYDIADVGTDSDISVDYPKYANLVCSHVTLDLNSIGVLVCSTGIGMSISANRYKGIRAALCRSLNDVRLARQHNDANVLVLGASTTSGSEATDMLNLFLQTSFDGGRHARRVQLIDSKGE